MPDSSGGLRDSWNTAGTPSVYTGEGPADPRDVGSTAAALSNNHTMKRAAACVAASELNTMTSAA
jgi:hypothetical protein